MYFYCNHSCVLIPIIFVCEIWCSTFEVQCTSLTKYTVSTVIVCELNNVRY